MLEGGRGGDGGWQKTTEPTWLISYTHGPVVVGEGVGDVPGGPVLMLPV